MARGTVLAPVDFFGGLRKGVKASLPAPLRTFSSARGRGRLMKLHFGHPEFHYEAWHHTGDGRLEIGLHFEGSRDENQEAFDFFRAHVLEIKAQLPRAELEPWDRGWTRLYETLPAVQLDEGVLDGAIERMSDYIVTLQPLLESWLKEQHGTA
ncbi:MAG TPA: hypothetical protein VG009_03335 [Candidatus Dormibacteraeota bacterium]|nr:hypothetical protein [Candidatus Dormibacteraeota bacterium]